jgi:hypothetical protein
MITRERDTKCQKQTYPYCSIKPDAAQLTDRADVAAAADGWKSARSCRAPARNAVSAV